MELHFFPHFVSVVAVVPTVVVVVKLFHRLVFVVAVVKTVLLLLSTLLPQLPPMALSLHRLLSRSALGAIVVADLFHY